MKTFWKLLGAAALAVGLTPYHVEKNEETGEKKYQALLWQATRTPQEGEKDALEINIGFKLPQTEEETHLFSDELCVEYTGTPASTSVEPEEPAAETPAEAPAAAPAEEEKEEA